MTEESKCKLCGEPMPPGEEMFFYHGYSGPCPKPPLSKESTDEPREPDAITKLKEANERLARQVANDNRRMDELDYRLQESQRENERLKAMLSKLGYDFDNADLGESP